MVCGRSGLTKKAEPPPTRFVGRDSGTDSANGGWLRRLVRPRHHHKSLNFLIAFRKDATAKTTPSNPPNANKILATTEFQAVGINGMPPRKSVSFHANKNANPAKPMATIAPTSQDHALSASNRKMLEISAQTPHKIKSERRTTTHTGKSPCGRKKIMVGKTHMTIPPIKLFVPFIAWSSGLT